MIKTTTQFPVLFVRVKLANSNALKYALTYMKGSAFITSETTETKQMGR